ncbi:hypothetical protein [Jiella sonneratiae]|uniref:Uncharacterized protein n=1 Tax=Jiella sonneratiae TaxID=2816856 RepID=A0ABS3J7U7_9HYPH|nr:hypothetical protein [Jiella sonneratiae]MBO0905215.1 hypothetical protein [Jiella sonneratiae]
MIRKTVIAVATLAVAATASVAGAHATSYWPTYSFYDGGHDDCRWVRQKVVVGHDYYGNPIYRWTKVRICD